MRPGLRRRRRPLPPELFPRAGLTRRLYRVHKWTGLLSAIVIALLYLSGAILTLSRQPQAITAGDATLAEVFAAVTAAYPQARIDGVQFGESYTVFAGLPSAYKQVRVDPKSVRTLGEQGPDTVMNAVRQFHIRLYFFGWQGRLAAGVVGLCVFLSAITGLLIYGPFVRGIFKQGLRFYQVRGGSQLALSDWHKLVGVSTAIFHLILGATGAILGIGVLTRNSPAMDAQLNPHPKAAPAVTTLHAAVAPDAALRLARQAIPHLRPTALLMPSARSPRYTIYGNTGFPLSRPSGSFVTIDAITGAALHAYDASQAAAFVQLYNLAFPLHYGDFGGWTVRALYLLGGLSGVLLPFTGFWLSFRKRRHQRQRLVPRAHASV